MGTQIQVRRGTTAEHASFTGAAGELTANTTKKNSGSPRRGYRGRRRNDARRRLTMPPSSMNFPSITAGDATKIIRVNSGGTGYELDDRYFTETGGNLAKATGNITLTAGTLSAALLKSTDGYVELTARSGPPSSPVVGVTYLADGTGWDPLSLGVPHAVTYHSVGVGYVPAYTLLAEQADGSLALASGDIEITDGGIKFTERTAAPSTPKPGGVYCADGATWDPLSRSGTDPYLVFYDGAAYVSFAAASSLPSATSGDSGKVIGVSSAGLFELDTILEQSIKAVYGTVTLSNSEMQNPGATWATLFAGSAGHTYLVRVFASNVDTSNSQTVQIDDNSLGAGLQFELPPQSGPVVVGEFFVDGAEALRCYSDSTNVRVWSDVDTDPEGVTALSSITGAAILSYVATTPTIVHTGAYAAQQVRLFTCVKWGGTEEVCTAEWYQYAAALTLSVANPVLTLDMLPYYMFQSRISVSDTLKLAAAATASNQLWWGYAVKEVV